MTAPAGAQLISDETWANAPRTVVIGLAGMVPKVGGVIQALLEAVWPKTERDLIAESEERMRSWVNGQFAAYDRTLLRQSLEGLRRNLTAYTEATTQTDRLSWLNATLAGINANIQHFMEPRDIVGSMSLTREFATIHLGLLRERVVYTEEIFGATDNAPYKAALKKQLKEYQDWIVSVAYPAVVQWRSDQIDITPPTFSDPGYHLIDQARGVYQLVKSEAVARQYREFFMNDTVLALRRNVLDVADAWSFLDPDYTEPTSYPRGRTVWIGPVGLSQWDYVHNVHEFPLANGLGRADKPGRITKIVVKEGVILDFIHFHFDWGRSQKWVGNSLGGTMRTATVPDGENIRQVSTFWNYTCMGIEFHYTNGTSSGVFGRKEQSPRPVAVHEASYPDHILTSVAVYGLPSPEYRNASASGISEIYFGFSPDPRLYA